MNFKLFLELFNSPAPVKWHMQGWNQIGLFTINNKNYKIQITQSPGEIIEVKFELIDGNKFRQDITGTGDELKVFSTVIFAIKQWAEEALPSSFIVTAREKNRRRLYLSLMRLLPKEWAYEDLGYNLLIYNKEMGSELPYGMRDSDFEFDID